MGPNHGVKLSVSEIGINVVNANVTASVYASILGEFARHAVEIFTPWSWNTGMSEVIHLYTHYSKPFYVDAGSSDENNVSAYPTINAAKDSMIIFLVNRNLTQSRTADLNLTDFPIKSGQYTIYRLSNLPTTETFISHTKNALVQSNVALTDTLPSLILPPLSITALVITRENFTPNQFGYLVTDAEAENGVLSGSVSIANSISGYSGTGYVTGFSNTTAGMVTVSMNVPETGLYKLVIRYGGPYGDKYQNLLVNSLAAGTIFFPSNAGYTEVEAGSYLLNKGANTFAISSNWGWTNIDKFELYPVMKNVYNPSPGLVDTLANDSTKALYNFLLNQFGQRIISGQTNDYYNQLKNVAGYSPMIRNGDLLSYTPGYSYLWKNGGFSFGIYDDGSVDTLIKWYKSTNGKGIIAYQWHWFAPSDDSVGKNTFYTQYTNFDVTKAVIPGTHEDSLIIRDIDYIAIQLKKFQDAGIPILWRPLHEAGGGWFWWGAKGPVACKKLYGILYDRLMNYHQLHNLIWVWSTPETAWYPGNDSVDIIGYDSYPGAYSYGNQKASFDVLYKLTQGKKLITMSENGPIPDIDACLNGDAPWLYFMSWGGQAPNLVMTQNSIAHIQQVYSNLNVLKLESTNAKTSRQWRSVLYPEGWKPGFTDSQGRYLHDFSFAGYHGGESEIPNITRNIIDITQAPYSADKTGATDVTSLIQKALDDVGSAGGGVVYLPPGTYKVTANDTLAYALRMSYDSTLLRGAGPDSTFVFNDQTNMRNKDIILIGGQTANWFDPAGPTTNILIDLASPTRIIPVASVSGFHTGDQVVLTATATNAFIDEHNMTGKWTASSIKGVAFLRRIDSIDAFNNFLFIDAPTRYFLKTRDQARVYLVKKQLAECGIENLSIGNTESPNSGFDENDYLNIGTDAYEVNASNAIELRNVVNSWIRNVHSYKPIGNADDFHVLSNGLLLNQCRFITIDTSFLQKSQYTGGGGNGNLYTLESNDCLIKNSRAGFGRHNFDFQYPYCNGNVILRCILDSSLYSSDFNRYLSMANLFDQCILNGDYFESVYSPYGGSAVYGYTSTQSVFYNTYGRFYHPGKSYIIDSRQFGNGYIIGTSGPAFTANVYPVEGLANEYYFNTQPIDFTEGIGNGQDLTPASLYLDQLANRKKNGSEIERYTVHVLVKDKVSNKPLSNSSVKLDSVVEVTNVSGIASFINVLEVFKMSINNKLYLPLDSSLFSIHSDTSLYFSLSQKPLQVTFEIFNNTTQTPLSGANVSFFNSTIASNSDGEAAFTITGDSLIYVISDPYFQNATGILSVQSDTVISINMIQTLADVKFWLSDGTTPVNKAYVKIGSDSVITNSLGIALFTKYAVSTSYHYVIAKSGYLTLDGDFYLNNDTNIYIAMQSVVFVPNISTASNAIQLWPNPLVDILNCSFPSTGTENAIRIIDVLGNVLYMNKSGNPLIQIKVDNFQPGIYIIHATCGKIQTERLFIKK